MDAVRRALRGFPALFCSRLKGAFPTIFFYILQFLLVSVLFGQRYIIVITCSTTLFQLRHKQYNSPWDYTRMFLVSLLLCLLAYAATRNVVLCVLLNLAVPVVLVFWKSSQFTPKGYLGFAMTFVFLELGPHAGGISHSVSRHAILLCPAASRPGAARPAVPSGPRPRQTAGGLSAAAVPAAGAAGPGGRRRRRPEGAVRRRSNLPPDGT
ncbi:hypothetical protein [Flavonifractor sp. An306]|uniref:hypothetical protein n=1 Tax=Flavonifractor sp. An306 TaxID=1965629 RepID=UPI001FA84DF1|nr:hypothetical protein [Flavonifractor sp. An306]